MKLQQVKLSGFKSFVDPTTITVHGQLVGIVGPNGCGKSNVIDAVRWVLGESSAKQLRGESMADVIFNGSIKRKPVSRAAVELVFDNSQKLITGLWSSYGEISIKRVLSRQGESSYYINNQQVRRKDITELFLGTGVGSKGYAVIEQGMISKIIESRPEDMRLFLEEAAGVSRYRERRKETLQRLRDTEENLQRLEDIHSEIFKQLASLEEQAKVAKLHQQLSHDLRSSQTLALALKVRDAHSILSDANHLIAHCEEELRVLGYQLEEVNLQLSSAQEHKALAEQKLQELMQQFNDHRTSLARVEERYKHYSELLKRFENESVDLAAKESEVTEDVVELSLQIENIEDQIATKQDELSEQTLAREELQLMVEDRQAKYDAILQQVTRRQDAINDVRHELELLQNSLKHKIQQKTNLSTRLARLEQEGHGLDFDENYHFIKEEIVLVEEELISNEIMRGECEQNLERLKNEQLIINEKLSQWQRTLAASDGKIATLRQLLTTVHTENEEDIFTASDTRELWQYLEVTTGYEQALEVALSNLLASKVISDVGSLRQIPSHEVGVWFTQSTAQDIVPITNSLSSYVKISDPQLHNLYFYLNDYCLLDDLASAASLPRGVLGVTRDGHLASCDYIIYNAGSSTSNVLQHQHQLLAEEDQYALSCAQIDSCEIELQTVNDKLTRRGNDLTSLSAKHGRLVSKKHELQLEFTKQEQIYVQNQRHQERITQERILLQQEVAHLSGEIEELEIQLEDLQLKSVELNEAGLDVEVEKVERETSLQLSKNRLQELDARANQLIIDNQLLQQQKQHSSALIEEKRLQLAAAKHKLAELSNERQTVNSSDQAQEILLLQEKIAAVATNMQQSQQKLDELSNKIIGLKNSASSLNANYQKNLEKINQTKFRQQEQNILLSTYQEQLTHLGLTYSDLDKLATDSQQSIAAIAEHCKQLEQQITGLGLVNLKAIEDLEAASVHQRELWLQIEDLRAAIVTLSDAIAQIDGETRKLLQNTFDTLNQAIVVYFRTLFGGGSARLALTDGDILQAGIQIFAEPPGKKNSTIHLLSGGEKALAAMSFVFALFSLNPAPFCLLDEVDAPLDDANTQRFCNLVQELANKTQFVYISHNRLAMEMADQLVGVTMQEKGVSTVVSVSLTEAIRHSIDDEMIGATAH